MTAGADITTDLEFSLWNGNSKTYGEYVTTSKTVTYTYTPTETDTYRINFRLRDYGYAGGDQTFYLDNVMIRNTVLALIEENNYYPFGLKHEGYNITVTSNTNAVATKFKYNGKELNDELGLDLYDYGARMYDPALGRWHVIDPMFDKHYDWSPYAYVLNNPILNIDLYGLTDWNAIWKGSAMVVTGVGSVVGGVAAMCTPTGVGQVGGAVLITTGVPTAGVGIGMIAAGIKDDGMSKKIPGGPLETAGIVGDKLAGNNNGELRELGSLGDIGLNVFVGGGPATVVEKVALGVQVITTATDISGQKGNTKVGGDSKSVDIDSRSVPDQKTDNTRIVKPIVIPVIEPPIPREGIY